jgi:hypothetical protein
LHGGGGAGWAPPTEALAHQNKILQGNWKKTVKKLFQYSRLILTTIEQSRRTNKVLFCRKANLRIPETTVEEEEETGKKI